MFDAFFSEILKAVQSLTSGMFFRDVYPLVINYIFPFFVSNRTTIIFS